MSWNDERVELLRKLWNDGLSASSNRRAARGNYPQCRDRQGAPARALGPGEVAVLLGATDPQAPGFERRRGDAAPDALLGK